MRRPRIRLWMLLLAVAVAGAILGWMRRRDYCLTRAQQFEALQGTYLNQLLLDQMPVRATDLRRYAFGFGFGDVAAYQDEPSRPTLVFHGGGEGQTSARREARLRAASEHYAKAKLCFRIANEYRRVALVPWLPLPREPKSEADWMAGDRVPFSAHGGGLVPIRSRGPGGH